MENDRYCQQYEKGKGDGLVKKVFRLNAILLTNLAAALWVIAILMVAVVVFSYVNYIHSFPTGGAGGIAFGFIFLLMIPGLPWVPLYAHLYLGASWESGLLPLCLISGSSIFLNAILVGSAVELIKRAKARRAEQALRVWGRKELWGTWLLILFVVLTLSYVNFKEYESSLAWQKAHPELLYKLSHPDALHKK